MSEDVLIAVIVAVQAVTVAVVGVVGPVIILSIRKVRRSTEAVAEDAAATREQVVNHHPRAPNLREENDGRHAETLRLFQEVRKDIGGMRSDLRAIGGRLTTLEQIEITHPRKESP
ncbi:MAG: hypothetical protein K0R01_143 [Mycobacterium sp.]|jgi:hypothetical protein|nr:hypothetical protein [Mycobacterium sp.]